MTLTIGVSVGLSGSFQPTGVNGPGVQILHAALNDTQYQFTTYISNGKYREFIYRVKQRLDSSLSAHYQRFYHP